MHPAFQSRGALIAAIAVNIGLLSIPLLVQLLKPADRRDVWNGIHQANGSIASIATALSDDHREADVLLIGSSSFQAGFLESELQSSLTKRLGRPARIDKIYLYSPGTDWVYFALRDYWKHHRAKLTILHDPLARPATNQPHIQMCNWLRLGDYSEAFNGIKPDSRFQVYSSLVLGGPRQLLSILRPNTLNAEELKLGSDSQAIQGFRHGSYGGRQFEELKQLPRTATVDALVAGDSKVIQRVADGLGDYSDHFIDQVFELSRAQNQNLVLMHMNGLNEFGRDTLPEVLDFSRAFGTRKALIGIPFNTLFKDLPRSELENYFWDQFHFNLNGARVFTRSVMPSVLKAYDHAGK